LGLQKTCKVSNQKTIRRLLVALALIVLLFVPLTLGSVWHHHANSSEANCSICHLDHQPVEPPVATDRTPALAQLGLRPELAEPAFTPVPFAHRLPARAPPAL
jgi:hypothetical protein